MFRWVLNLLGESSDDSSMMDIYSDYESSTEEEEEREEVAIHAVTETIARGSVRLVKRLVNEENVNSLIDGETPLIAACRGKNLSIVTYLVKIGAEILKQGTHRGINYYPLTAACRFSSLNVVKFLLEHSGARGIDLSACLNQALHEACTRANHGMYLHACEMLKLLIGAGADVNSTDALYGQTPLMYTVNNLTYNSYSKARKCDMRQFLFLLEAGAEPDVRDRDGNSPLDVTFGHPVIFKELVMNGADVNNFNLKALVPERRVNFAKCFELLLEYNVGVEIICKCDACPEYHDLLTCYYLQLRFQKNYHGSWVRRLEEHFIRMCVARSYVTKGCSVLVQFCCSFYYYRDKNLSKFCKLCHTEMVRMSEKKIQNTGLTYLEVFIQSRKALLRIKYLCLLACQESFPIYGGVIHSRFITGRMKLSLVDKCMGIFNLTELPQLPESCVAEILNYLSVRDLKSVLAAHTPQRGYQKVTEPGPSLGNTGIDSAETAPSDGSTGKDSAIPGPSDGTTWNNSEPGTPNAIDDPARSVCRCSGLKRASSHLEERTSEHKTIRCKNREPATQNLQQYNHT